MWIFPGDEGVRLLPRCISYTGKYGNWFYTFLGNKQIFTDFQSLLLAATLIKDAMNGRNMEYKTDPKSIR